MTLRRTKIVCTLGPRSDDLATITALIEAGMNMARINCSHGNIDARRRTMANVREAERVTGSPVSILLDLAGPKIRTGTLADGKPVQLHDHARFTLHMRKIEGSATDVSINYPELVHDVAPGHAIYLCDGRIRLRVVEVGAEEVVTVVEQGGELGERKGLNVVGGSISTPPFTEKDRGDLEAALQFGVDMVALSFVRHADDVFPVREVIRRSGHDIPVVAKVERPEAIRELDGILDMFDSIMVARGDLGIEVGVAGVPVLQKMMIHKAIAASKPVITATEMLETMITNPRPTRAEASDVANAVFDGTDAVMLSGETANGIDPVRACRTMAEIVTAAEESPIVYRHIPSPAKTRDPFQPIGHAAAMLAREAHVKAICVFSRSGYSARLISSHRPTEPIFMFSPSVETARRCQSLWGVFPRLLEVSSGLTTDRLIPMMADLLKTDGKIAPGEFMVVLARTPVATAGRTDTIKLHKVQ